MNDEEEKIKAVIFHANNCLANLRRREKASKAAYDYTGARKGIRGGKRTTLDARLSNACQIYDSSLSDLKKALKQL